MKTFAKPVQLVTNPVSTINAFLSNPGNLFPSDIYYNDLFDPNVQRWSNVAFADNYYQELGSAPFTLTPNGRSLDLVDINIALSGNQKTSLPARAGFTEGQWGDYSHIFGMLLPEIGGPHSRVWRWYAGTIDLGLTQFESSSAGEPIYRSLADKDFEVTTLTGTHKFPFGGVDIPWYTAHEYVDTSPFNYRAEDAVWEGIGEGWAFSPLGGVAFQGTVVGVTDRISVGTDNADTAVKHIVNPNNIAVESVFNGNFDHGTARLGTRFPVYELDAPGWAFHNGQAFGSRPINLDSYPVATRAIANYVAVLNAGLDAELVHNRFYIDSQATTLRFNYFTRVVEKGVGNEVYRKPNLDVMLRVNGQEHQLGRLSTELMAIQNPTGDPATDPTATFNIPTALRGQVGELIFRMSIPSTEPAHQSGVATVWLDNVTILSAQPLATDVPAQGSAEQPIGLRDSLEGLTEAARSWWTDSVQSPDGIVGVPYGSIGAPTADFFGSATGSNGGDHYNLGNTGFGEGGLHDERSLMNTGTVLGQPARSFSVDRAGFVADQEGIFNNNTSLSSDSHSINAGNDTVLQLCQHATFTSLIGSVVDKCVTDETDVIKDGSFIDYCAIKVSDLNLGFDSSSPSGEGTIPHFQVNNVQGLTFVSLPELSAFIGEIDGLEIINPLLYFRKERAGGQSDADQNQQELLSHSPSFGTPTLPPDRGAVKDSGAFSAEMASGQWQVASGIGEASHVIHQAYRPSQSSALSPQSSPQAAAVVCLVRDGQAMPPSLGYIHAAYRQHGYRLAEIAAHLGVHYATVSHRLKQAEQLKV